MKTELKNIATDLAYKLGGVLTITTVMAYSVDFKLFLNPFIGIGFGIFIILFGVYSIYQSKKQNSGIISFGEAFKSFFITISLGYFIGSLTTILIFVIIDPEAAKILDASSKLVAIISFDKPKPSSISLVITNISSSKIFAASGSIITKIKMVVRLPIK